MINSLVCGNLTWTLFFLGPRFPYPSVSEIVGLSSQTKFSEEQIKVWFSAQRLKHGVSWTPEEVGAWTVTAKVGALGHMSYVTLFFKSKRKIKTRAAFNFYLNKSFCHGIDSSKNLDYLIILKALSLHFIAVIKVVQAALI